MSVSTYFGIFIYIFFISFFICSIFACHYPAPPLCYSPFVAGFFSWRQHSYDIYHHIYIFICCIYNLLSLSVSLVHSSRLLRMLIALLFYFISFVHGISFLPFFLSFPHKTAYYVLLFSSYTSLPLYYACLPSSSIYGTDRFSLSSIYSVVSMYFPHPSCSPLLPLLPSLLHSFHIFILFCCTSSFSILTTFSLSPLLYYIAFSYVCAFLKLHILCSYVFVSPSFLIYILFFSLLFLHHLNMTYLFFLFIVYFSGRCSSSLLNYCFSL